VSSRRGCPSLPHAGVCLWGSVHHRTGVHPYCCCDALESRAGLLEATGARSVGTGGRPAIAKLAAAPSIAGVRNFQSWLVPRPSPPGSYISMFSPWASPTRSLAESNFLVVCERVVMRQSCSRRSITACESSSGRKSSRLRRPAPASTLLPRLPTTLWRIFRYVGFEGIVPRAPCARSSCVRAAQAFSVP